MTSADNDRQDRGAHDLLAEAAYVLLDFDGPVCRLFSARPAHRIARRMHSLLDDPEPRLTKPAMARSLDPHGILRVTADPELTRRLEPLLAKEEELAALTAQPTPYAHDFIRDVADTGRMLAVTTNNAPGAVHAYLKHHDLDGCFAGRVFGRSPRNPARMKPDPDCLLRAVDALSARPDRCLMIGDSPQDAEAAKAAKIGFLGFARTAERADRLRGIDPHPVVVGMKALHAIARVLGPPPR